MSKREKTVACQNCEGRGFIWIFIGHDMGYGFPEYGKENCPNCRGGSDEA